MLINTAQVYIKQIKPHACLTQQEIYHRKKKKVEPSWVIPRKFTASLELLIGVHLCLIYSGVLINTRADQAVSHNRLHIGVLLQGRVCALKKTFLYLQ